jgi:ATP-dependent helicase/nuclease subunit B
MQASFGLPPPERRIGLAAHDVEQALCHREVVLTRAARIGEAPAVPSRWLQRLDAVLTAGGLDAHVDRDGRAARLLAWQAKLDEAAPLPQRAPPAPCPPVAARPRKLSVTEIEKWRRDPYAVYARHVLRLEPLEPLDQELGAADRGTYIHAALARFIREKLGALGQDDQDVLLKLGASVFGPALAQPAVWAFWWPRFEVIARWFLFEEKRRRPLAMPLAVEVKGRLTFRTRGGEFTLSARADRIDRSAEGTLEIIDYKTGGVPTQREVREGFSPQLPLEAAIAKAGGFADVAAAAVDGLAYWQMTGGRTPGKTIPIKGDAAELAAEALDGLKRMVELFDDKDTPYLARPNPDRAPAYSDYAHLARVKEWAVEDES